MLTSICFCLSACSFPFKTKVVNPHNPLSSAKDFVDAMTSGDTVELNQVIYKNQSMPADKIMDIAKIRHIVGMDPKHFTYKPDPKDKETIFVSFTDRKNVKDKWRLVFIKNTNDVYQYAGSFSGTLMGNSTSTEAMRSYAEILIHNEDKDWFNDLSMDKKPGSALLPSQEEIKFAHKYKLNKKSINDFKIKKENLSLGAGIYSMSVLQFKDDKSRSHKVDYFYIKKDDGYYLKGTGGTIETSKSK